MKKKIFPVILILAIAVMAFGAVTAYAYFTTYVEAKGMRTVHLGDTTTIEEEYEDWQKDVRILNNEESAQAVWVRAQAFAGGEYALKYENGGEGGWIDGGDGFWYYGKPVAPGEASEVLSVIITDKEGNKPVAEEGKSFNVVVVYETVPAVQAGEDEAGNVQYLDADWSAQVNGGDEL